MAQFLKEEQRQAIIEAARNELSEKGYKDASMRSIAAKAEMMVGNLYRYFRNKEEIQEFIVSAARDEIGRTLRELSVDMVTKEARVFNIRTDTNELSELMERFADRMMDIYQHYRSEFLILLSDDRTNEMLYHWISKTIRSLVSQHFLFDGQQPEREALVHSYATSICSGMKEIFHSEELSPDSLRTILQIYLRSFVMLLDSDLTQRNDAYSFYHIPKAEE